ncbi:hypothetical protein CEXT_697281 [Caerostris extrusa]|uniref:Uncharacterized protein n=1 Tax=Caerostris extrusa TaxID=172846 RepID=A0AAV4YGQ0_CAEEX|nr:hypothetical protein CEXT_697281 [Caerostris extrusa]
MALFKNRLSVRLNSMFQIIRCTFTPKRTGELSPATLLFEFRAFLPPPPFNKRVGREEVCKTAFGICMFLRSAGVNFSSDVLFIIVCIKMAFPSPPSTLLGS